MNKEPNLNHSRWILIFGISLVLAGLVWYGYRYNPKVTMEMCLDNPLQYDGEEIDVGTEATVIKLLPDGFILHQVGHTIRVKGDPQNVSIGDFVQMRAVFHKEGYLESKRLYVAKRRRLKIVVSIVPALLVLFLLIRTYQFNWRRMLFCERI